jgi:predicted nucleic acid-binding protein
MRSTEIRPGDNRVGANTIVPLLFIGAYAPYPAGYGDPQAARVCRRRNAGARSRPHCRQRRKPRPNPKVVAWLQDVEDSDLHLSAVTVGEIQAGIEVTGTQDPVKAEELEAWADQVADSYNVLPMDAVCFRRWAKLMHRQSSTDYEDAMIAATALVHYLTVVTRNERDFSRFDVPVLNPFE